jgi:hypothetical protein
MRRSLVQKEHVVDDTKTDDLRRGAKETLQRSARSETTIARRESGANGADERGKLRPEENRSTTVALTERHCEKTTRSLHEDGTGDGVGDGGWGHVPLHGLGDEEGDSPGDDPVGEEA